MICPVAITNEMSAFSGERSVLLWRPRKHYSEAAVERMMNDVIMRALAKKIRWYEAAEILGISVRQSPSFSRQKPVNASQTSTLRKSVAGNQVDSGLFTSGTRAQ